MSLEKAFIAGFKWAVPSAFIDALASCRFEEGDILYDTQEAYGSDWSIARMKIKNCVQVRFPSRGSTGANQAENAVFMWNWESPVDVDLYTYPEISVVRKYETTQGRLYSLLWHGDLSLLDPQGPDITPPVGAKALLKELETVRDVALKISEGDPVFVMPYDHVGRLTHLKLATLRRVMKKQTTSKPKLITCAKAGITDSEKYSPTVAVAVFTGKGMSYESLEAAVKQSFYKPSKAAKNPKFNLGRHGAIFWNAGV